MVKSIRSRLNGNDGEVLRDTELYGWGYAMDKWGVKDYIAFARYIEDKTQNPNFGRNPKFNLSGGQNFGDQLMEAMANYILRTSRAVGQKDKRIEFLEWQLKANGMEITEKAANILQACRGKEAIPL